MQVVTLVQGVTRRDVAVSEGTTVAQLATLVGSLAPPNGGGDGEATTLRLTTADGSPLDAGLDVSTELEAGSVVVVQWDDLSLGLSRGSAMRREAGLGSVLAGHQPIPGSFALVVASGLALSVLLPLLAGLALPRAGLIILVSLLVVVLVSVVRRTDIIRTPGGAIALPGLAGFVPLGFIPPRWPWALTVGLPLGLSLAFAVAVALWLWVRSPTTLVAVVAWAVMAAAGVVTGVIGLAPAQIAAPLIAAAGVFLYLIPRYVVAIPESQLVDTPLLAVSAVNAHLPQTESPHRIAPRWIAGVVSDAQHLSDAICVVTCGTMVGWTVASFSTIDVTGLSGGFYAGTLACSILLLWLVPRAGQTAVVRIAPRVSAGILLLVGMALFDSVIRHAWFIPVALCSVVLAVVLFAAWHSQTQTYTMERVSDIVQSLALAALLPCAVVASGLFGWIWEAAT